MSSRAATGSSLAVVRWEGVVIGKGMHVKLQPKFGSRVLDGDPLLDLTDLGVVQRPANFWREGQCVELDAGERGGRPFALGGLGVRDRANGLGVLAGVAMKD